MDDGIWQRHLWQLSQKIKAAFKKDGSTTAGNARQVSNGAGAVLLMRRDVALHKGLPIHGVFRSFVAVGVDPAAVKAAYLQIDNIDLFEINEEFASQYVYAAKLELDPERMSMEVLFLLGINWVLQVQAQASFHHTS